MAREHNSSRGISPYEKKEAAASFDVPPGFLSVEQIER
jgi:hypothetical protein